MLDETSTLGAEPPEPQPEEKGNKTFLIVGAIFAGLIFLTLVCMALYFLVWVPRSATLQANQEETAEALRLEQAQAMTQTAEAAYTPTLLPSPIPSKTPTRTATLAASSTPVVVVTTPLASPVSDPATLVALQTQLAGQMTQTAAALSTSAVAGAGPLPTTGFFDEVGLPLLIVLTAALLTVILIARRLRKSPSR
jgi:hypothetical protein